jgi:cytochrome c oxidase cbb3-type subunit 2
VDRYGHYSIAAESMYDHPFQWGSKRTGPDLARIGNKYSNAWHVAHLTNPRDVLPYSIMPAFAFLHEHDLRFDDIELHLRALRDVGVPYTDEMIAHAAEDIRAQASSTSDAAALQCRYPGARNADFANNPGRITEMDALIAYLQVLGTMVDFSPVGAPAPAQ